MRSGTGGRGSGNRRASCNARSIVLIAVAVLVCMYIFHNFVVFRKVSEQRLAGEGIRPGRDRPVFDFDELPEESANPAHGAPDKSTANVQPPQTVEHPLATPSLQPPDVETPIPEEPEVEPTTEPQPVDDTDFSGYTVWSNDFHISPIADLKDIFKELDIYVIDKSLSGHCHLKGTCATDLRVLNKGNGIELGHCPNQVIRDFFEGYKSDPVMQGVDAFVCHHPSAMCEVFMPFNKPLIVHASTRFEMGRHSAQRWRRWVENLRHMASKPYNIIAANNLYDAEYIKYFTGLKDVEVIPNYCGYMNLQWTPEPSKTQILVGPGHVNGAILRQLQSASRRAKAVFHRDQLLAKNERGKRKNSEYLQDFQHLRTVYPGHFEYSDLVKHPALVLLPYQVSVMSLFEYYRMAIPLFVPSVQLLAEWHMHHGIISERTWDRVRGRPKGQSDIERHPDSSIPYDPNNEHDKAAIEYWIKYADFYQWPHITTFNSFEDLFDKLGQADLHEISRQMVLYNRQFKLDLKAQWRAVFKRMWGNHRHPEPKTEKMSFEEAMMAVYNSQVEKC